MAKTLIVIAGPTAVGKTALSIKVASYFNTEIISADSRQFYREISIGTAKPSAEQLSLVKHHFINNKSLKENYSVADYETEALAMLDTLFKTHEVVICAGGSGLYINALCNGLDELPKTDEAVRLDLQKILDEIGIISLQNMLKEKDENHFNKMDIQNPQRLLRALEILIVTGKKMGDVYSQTPKVRPFNILKICLNAERDLLYQRINERVDEMVKNNLEDEALAWYHLKKLNALNTVGYREFFDYFEGVYSYPEAVDKIKQNSRNYAKRQLTWFRKDEQYKWFDSNNELELVIPYINEQLAVLNKNN
jgi:tRNA dimethylallyltransferase